MRSSVRYRSDPIGVAGPIGSSKPRPWGDASDSPGDRKGVRLLGNVTPTFGAARSGVLSVGDILVDWGRRIRNVISY